MMSNSASKILFICVVCIASAACEQPPNPQKGARKIKTIFSTAHVNGRVKDIDGVPYRLMATEAAFMSFGMLTSLQSMLWIVDGRLIHPTTIVPVDSGFTGNLDSSARRFPPRDARGLITTISLQWIKTPGSGELEMLLGAANMSGVREGDIATLRKQMLDRGFVPYSRSVAKLPNVEAKTVAELVSKMHKLTDARLAKKQGAR